MKYTKYNYDKKVYIIGKNHTSKSELDAEWKDDVGIPTSEFDIKSIIKTIEATGKETKILRQLSFVVLHSGHRYVVSFYFSANYEITCILDSTNQDNSSGNSAFFYGTKRDIRKSTYLITEEDIDTLEKSKNQILKNFGLSKCMRVDITIY